MRLADYVVQRLEEVGIDHAFTVCGGGSIFLNDALRKAKKMKYVCTHHEQAAAIAAEAYARVRNSYGLAVVTSGPGGTNAITGVASAWQDSVPTITISGQVFSNQMISTRRPGLRSLGVQEINIVDIVRPITKYAAVVNTAKDIGWHLDMALSSAVSGRPGPVWLDIPADVQNAEVDMNISRFKSWYVNPLVRLANLVDLLRQAKRPLVHVGQGVRIAKAEDEFFSFVEKYGIPFITARNANDICDSSHPLYIGRAGTFAQRGANFAVQSCDLYIAIGTRLSLAQTGYNAKDYARNAKIVIVDIDEVELTKQTVKAELLIQADAKDFLTELLRQTESQVLPNWSLWLRRCKELQAKYPPVTEEKRRQSEYVNSYHLIEELSKHLTPDDIVVTDVGFAYQNIHQAFSVKKGQRVLSSNGLAPMGWGLPAAVGAAVGSGKRVICMTGDGGLMFNSQELSTIAHHKLPIKIFLLNNGGYLTMRQSQEHAFEGYMGSDEKSGISFPDFKQLAGAHGLPDDHGTMRSQKLGWHVGAALQQPGPVLCEIGMDPHQPQIPKSINRRLEDGTIKQTALEDAWPYLPQEEIQEALRA